MKMTTSQEVGHPEKYAERERDRGACHNRCSTKN